MHNKPRHVTRTRFLVHRRFLALFALVRFSLVVVVRVRARALSVVAKPCISDLFLEVVEFARNFGWHGRRRLAPRELPIEPFAELRHLGQFGL